MNVEELIATNPGDGRYVELIRSAFRIANPREMLTATAYATQSGVAELEASLREFPGWSVVYKRWLVGIDYCRSDPVALSHLNTLPESEVRIFDGLFVASRAGCVPRNSYHPKVYLLQGEEASTVVVGSGNLSRTGLCFGIEAGMTASSRMEDPVRDIRHWFSDHWSGATPFEEIQEQYDQRYGSRDNRQHPVVSEEDTVPESAWTRGQLGPEELRKLRVCRHLWIEAGNLHRNRGPRRAGNQLMLKRNSRVFFGFPARDLTTNSTVGSVAIRSEETVRQDCSLRFSDNSMDVLTLPVPGTEGPESYDQKTLHFEKVGVREFSLTIGGAGEVGRWKRWSRSIGGDYRMQSGRGWGVY